MSVSVCLRVCLSAIISGTTRPIFTKFLCMLPMAVARSFSVRRSDTLRISGFMDDVMSAHKLRLLDVAARLRQ